MQRLVNLGLSVSSLVYQAGHVFFQGNSSCNGSSGHSASSRCPCAFSTCRRPVTPVLVPGGVVPEGLTAPVAAEWLLPGVDAEVRLELVSLGETLSALAALVWLLPGVHPLVDLQALLGGEALAAVVERAHEPGRREMREGF